MVVILYSNFFNQFQTSVNGSYPVEIDTLVERKVLFKVQINTQNISEHNEVYTVMRLTDNNELISKYVLSCYIKKIGLQRLVY